MYANDSNTDLNFSVCMKYYLDADAKFKWSIGLVQKQNLLLCCSSNSSTITIRFWVTSKGLWQFLMTTSFPNKSFWCNQRLINARMLWNGALLKWTYQNSGRFLRAVMTLMLAVANITGSLKGREIQKMNWRQDEGYCNTQNSQSNWSNHYECQEYQPYNFQRCTDHDTFCY